MCNTVHAFEEAVKFTEEDRKNELLARLADYLDEDLRNICCDAYSWDGSFEHIGDAFLAEDIADYVSCEDPYWFMCRVVFGKVDRVDSMLRFNAYGNLESIDEWELNSEARMCIGEIADWLMDNWDKCGSLYEEDVELLNAWEAMDAGTYENKE